MRNHNIKALKRKIKKFEIISFDIFDTLVKRNCSKPTDIFKIVEKRVNKQIKCNYNFFNKRIDAERLARKKSSNNEVTLDDIYSLLDILPEDKELFKKMEIRTEIEFCQRNYDIYDIYKYCKDSNKKIIAISNMYLSKETLNEILNNCGYEIEDIFVSCEHGASKQKGILFNTIIENNNIDKRKIIHIGDGFKADYLGAKSVGIKSVKINRHNNNMYFNNYKKFLKRDNSLEQGIIFSTINNNCNQYKNYYSKIGYEIMGPLCLQFANWIRITCNQEKKNNILFCARDMKLINDIYSILFKGEKYHYFYVSRRSTYLPYLYKRSNYNNFVELLPNKKKNTSIGEVLNILNINKDYNEIISNYNLNTKDKYNTLMDILSNDDFKKFYKEELVKDIETEGKKQYDNFIKYLKSLDVNSNTVIVDLGWRGSTQKILMQILNYDITGLYLGLIDKHPEIARKCHTFLFDEKNNKYYEKIYPAEEIIELMFSSLEGTTLSYTNNDDKPYLLKKSLNEGNKEIEKIQCGVINFINDIKRYNDLLDRVDSELYSNKLLDIVSSPSLKQAKMLGDLYSEDYKIKYIAKPKSIKYYLFHPKEIVYDFADSSWKVGFLKRVFRIKLPYFLIFKIIKRVKYGNK